MSQRVFSLLILLSGTAVFAPISAAAELSGVATLTSEYIYRGMEVSNGNPAVQLGIDYGHDSGFFAGAWATTADLTSPAGQRDVELDYYAGFQFVSDSPLSAMVTVLRYTYPGQSTLRSYDYTEFLVSADWRENYSIEFAFTKDLYGFDNIARHWALRTEWPVHGVWVLGASLGTNDMSDAGVSPYLHWDIGASARFSRLTFDLRWYDNEPLDGFAARYETHSRFVLSASAAF